MQCKNVAMQTCITGFQFQTVQLSARIRDGCAVNARKMHTNQIRIVYWFVGMATEPIQVREKKASEKRRPACIKMHREGWGPRRGGGESE